jgi:glycosyltransferase involved in cell wall biosynthesis
MTSTERDPLAQVRLQTVAIIPAYQDEKHIGDIVRRTRKQLEDVLVVDDGSTDRTAQRAREAGAEVIVHEQNRGKGEAIKTGLAHWLAAANTSRRAADELDRQVIWISLLDSDGQHLPEEIDRFLTAAASSTHPTFLIGNRMNNVTGMPFIRRIVNRYMSRQISRVCKQEIPDTQCGFRMLDHQLIPQLLEGGDGFDYDTEVLIIASRKGYLVKSVPITTVYTDQVSKIRPLRDAIRFLKLMWRYRNL